MSWAIVSSFAQGQDFSDVPNRPDEDFEVVIDYNFKRKPMPNPEEKNVMEFYTTPELELLPHISVQVKLKNMKPNELKGRVIGNLEGMVTNYKKLGNKPIIIDFGFLEDLNENLVSNKYTLLILDKKKNTLNKIVLLIQKDGTFLVNGKVNGKF